MTQDNADVEDEVQTIELAVDPDAVINGIKLVDRDVNRTLVFHKTYRGGYSKGKLQDVTGLMWDGAQPILLSPKMFIPSHVGMPGVVSDTARREAKKEGADPDEWAEEAREVWEYDARHSLKEEIQALPYPHESNTVYKITYVDT